MFSNVLTFSITINGRELDVSRVQPVLDRLTAALLETENPLATLERIIQTGQLPDRPKPKRARAKKTPGEVVAVAVAAAVEAAAPVVAAVLSRRRGQ